MSEPRIVLLDLETLPNMREVMKVFPRLGAYPGLTLKATVNSIICVGYEIYGEKKAKCVNAWDFPKRWHRNLNDDYALCEFAYGLLKEADGIVTHNGRRFDWKFLQTRLMYHDFPPLPKIPHIDTCSLLKSNLFLFNNKLETAAKFLTSEEKMDNGGWDLWVEVSERCPKAQKKMSDYCKQDVVSLREVFRRLRPFAARIPNYNLFSVGAAKNLCPACGGTRLVRNGTRGSALRLFQSYLCRDCGTSSRTDLKDQLPRAL